jgi:hypothetical protein
MGAPDEAGSYGLMYSSIGTVVALRAGWERRRRRAHQIAALTAATRARAPMTAPAIAPLETWEVTVVPPGVEIEVALLPFEGSVGMGEFAVTSTVLEAASGVADRDKEGEALDIAGANGDGGAAISVMSLGQNVTV